MSTVSKKTVFAILEKSLAFRGVIFVLIFASVTLVILDTFDELPLFITRISLVFEVIITTVFTVEYLARLWTAPLLYPDLTPARARLRFALSLSALIDLVAIMPSYLALLVPLEVHVLRIIRVFRIFRLLKIDRYAKALNSVASAMKATAGQLLSSLVVIFLLLLVASIFMYLVEHDAQPEVFNNALSGLWWAISTVTTVGYGDIYPVTVVGKLLGAFVALLGVGLIAIPAGILSAGFAEQQGSTRTTKKDKKDTD